MKKFYFPLILFALCATTLSAQNTGEERAARVQQRQQNQTEALIKDLKLTDEQESTFREIYTRYQTELATTMSVPTQREQTKSKNKELSDSEATTQLTAYFENQTMQVQNQQKRLEIQKKYLLEFSALLTPQQVLKIFKPTRQNQERNRGNDRGRFPSDRGGDFGGGDFGGGDFGGGNFGDGGFGGPGF